MPRSEGRHSLSRPVRRVTQLPSSPLAAQVARAFRALDIDDSGYIELPELLHFGAAIGAGWSQAACEALLGRMDADGDRRISLAEFEGFVSEVRHSGEPGGVARSVAWG